MLVACQGFLGLRAHRVSLDKTGWDWGRDDGYDQVEGWRPLSRQILSLVKSTSTNQELICGLITYRFALVPNVHKFSMTPIQVLCKSCNAQLHFALRNLRAILRLVVEGAKCIQETTNKVCLEITAWVDMGICVIHYYKFLTGWNFLVVTLSGWWWVPHSRVRLHCAHSVASLAWTYWKFQVEFSTIVYCIAGTFMGNNFHELVECKLFAEKTFVDCSLVLQKDATLPNFVEKIFANSHKTSKFPKNFLLYIR